MLSSQLTSFASILSIIASCMLFSGCENPDLSQHDQVVPQQSLKPPITEDDMNVPEVSEYQGNILQISESTVRIASDDGSEREFMIDPTTTITLDDAISSTTRLTIGQRVTIAATIQEDLLTASKIAADTTGVVDSQLESDHPIKKSDQTDVRPNATDDLHVDGTIQSVSVTELVVTDENGERYSFVLDETTTVTLDGEEADIGNLMADQQVTVDSRTDAAKGKFVTMISVSSK